ncbi:hypothetical protein EVA_05738 [gut metagenome]|uniref:Uncharacterized protein n=1 Tax=gut metagenome TaxID=749906 RepID=J9GZ40_9ZZZZ
MNVCWLHFWSDVLYRSKSAASIVIPIAIPCFGNRIWTDVTAGFEIAVCAAYRGDFCYFPYKKLYITFIRKYITFFKTIYYFFRKSNSYELET